MNGDITIDLGSIPESLERIVCVSVTHRTAPTDRIGELAPSNPLGLAATVRNNDRVTGAAVLSTCNRVEVYAATRTTTAEDLDVAVSRAANQLGDPECAQEYTGLEAAAHLTRVACGLESAVLGEDQILGQVSEAFDQAAESGLAPGVLSRVAESAVRAGKTAREETAINEGTVSYGSAVCAAIADAGVRPERVLVIGAGEMARTALEAIVERWGPRVDVANRSEHHDLPKNGGRYYPLEDLTEALTDADAVVSATGASEPVLTGDHVSCLPPATPIVDLANPRDTVDSIRRGYPVIDLDDIATRVAATAEDRRAAATAAEDVVASAIERLVIDERENRAEDVLRALHCKAAQTREQQFERAAKRLEDGPADPEEVLEDFASALTGRLLAEPTAALRAAARERDEETIEAARRLFDLAGGGWE